MLLRLLLALFLAVAARANTETYLYKVPNYYNIPHHLSASYNAEVVQLNASTLLLRDHPILSAGNYTLERTTVTVPYDFASQPANTLFVKVNNYLDSTFGPNDVLNVKLCWPATTPVDFALSHRYVRSGEFGDARNDLDVYIVVDYQANFYALQPVEKDSFEFQLVISKLPSAVPIPIELFDVIVYVADILIVTVPMLPHIIAFLTH